MREIPKEGERGFEERQAVLLIHGIGEQKPMDTLRSFVESILDDSWESAGDKYWSKPDPLSASFELRRLVTKGRYKTDFFEYYWAHHVEGTTIVQLGRWFFSLIARRKKDVPDHLLPLWRISRALTSLFLLLMLSGGFSFFPKLEKESIAWLIAAASVAVIQWWLIRYLGDAARYLSPAPENISLRQKIRSEGVAILRDLHECRKYNRIIVVGHSLGSVIGYDLLKFLWYDIHDIHTNPCRTKQPHIQSIAVAGAGIDPRNPESAALFWSSQYQLWKEQVRISNPWRVSDFITLGSPLAHAMMLMAHSREDFERRKRQREMPICPPDMDKLGYAFTKSPPYEQGGGKISLKVLHHAAPFAVTRWTNIYFPAFFGIFGDIVGGPLRNTFGLGVRDVPVTTLKWWGLGRFTLASHTLYWHVEKKRRKSGRPPRAAHGGQRTVSRKNFPDALHALKEAINLEAYREYLPAVTGEKKRSDIKK